MSIKKFILFSLVLILSACSSHPIVPEKDSVKVSKEKANKDCRSLGDVEGKSLKVIATASDALDDLKEEAARKGANYVVLGNYSAQGSAVRGEAFFCP